MDTDKKHSRRAEWHISSHKLTKNEAGEPRRLYHGSLKNFESFDHTKGENSMFGRGVYLTSSADDAGRYASKDVGINPDIPAKAEWLQKEYGIPYVEAREIILEGSEQIYPLYVHMEKPIIIGNGIPIKNVDYDTLVFSLKLTDYKNPEVAARRFLSLSSYGQNREDDLHLFFRDSEIKRMMERYNDPSVVQMLIIGNSALRELMISINADGIIINNVNNLYTWMEEGSAHYFVRLPEQVKSVFNSGAYNERSSSLCDNINSGPSSRLFERNNIDAAGEEICQGIRL